MFDVYDWETNTLKLNDKYNNKFLLEFKGNKTIVKGSSGTGKTFLCNRIRAIQNNFNADTKLKADNIIILDRYNKKDLKSFREKLIIIDNAELLLDDNDIDIINMDDSNRYLIFSREPLGIEVSPNHQADMIYEDAITILQYRFNVKGWC